MSTEAKTPPPEGARQRSDGRQGAPTNREQLKERRAGMPVIDVARVPWRVLRERWPKRAAGVFLWLRVVRPVAVTLFWLLVVRYAWTHFFGRPDELPVWQQVTLYGIAVLVIVLSMLLLAPLRRREVRGEPAAEEAESTLTAISEFANVTPEELERWQQAQRLVVHHDESGGLHTAEDTAHLLDEAAHRPKGTDRAQG